VRGSRFGPRNPHILTLNYEIPGSQEAKLSWQDNDPFMPLQQLKYTVALVCPTNPLQSGFLPFAFPKTCCSPHIIIRTSR